MVSRKQNALMAAAVAALVAGRADHRWL